MLLAPEFRDTARVSDKNKKGADRSRRHQPSLLSSVGSLAMSLVMRRASSSEIFLVRRGTGELVMTFC